MPSSYDALVIGAGPNGLVAANRLVDAGWSVLVLEAQPGPGGAVRSDRELHPDYVHDTFSAFYPLAAASPTIRALGLEEHGLVWRHAPAVLGHPLPDGSWALQHRDRALTAQWLDALHPGEGERWLRLCEQWDLVGDAMVRALVAPFPPVRSGVGALAGVARAGGLDFVRTLLSPATDLARHRFEHEAARLLLAGNAGHADLPLDSPGSGVFALLLTMLGQTVGFPVPEGGAGSLAEALASRLRSRGGALVCDAEVVAVEVDDGRAVGVRTADGTRFAARHAVLADVIATRLFNDLLPAEVLPRRVRRGLADFQLDPSTVKVDWALSSPVPWSEPPAQAPGTVHIADSVEELATTLAQVSAGTIPARPFLLAGQMTSADPTRSPAGTESMWAYTHVPQPGATVRDGGGELTGRWDHSDLERFADRMQARIERFAPDFAARVVRRRVLGPHELEARDANLVGGAINGGTAQLQQQLVFRPVPAMRGRPETGIRSLYLASASAHPGGGVHGAPGNNAARAALWQRRIRRS